MLAWRPLGRTWAPAPPPGLVLTVAALKAQCRIDAADEDALLARICGAAVSVVENWTQRLLAARSCVLVLPGLPGVGEAVELPGGVVQSITSVVARTAGGDVTMDAGDYETLGNGPARLALRDLYAAWPAATQATVTYVAGYASVAGSPTDYAANVPPDLVHAATLIAADMFTNREHSGRSLTPVPINAQWLMQPWRIAPISGF
jgi:uncharacterized phiE125 gp8 family phage protein